MPMVNIAENDKEYLITAKLPEVKKEVGIWFSEGV